MQIVYQNDAFLSVIIKEVGKHMKKPVPSRTFMKISPNVATTLQNHKQLRKIQSPNFTYVTGNELKFTRNAIKLIFYETNL